MSQSLQLQVQLIPPRPNKMYPEWMTERLFFMRYTGPVTCAECGKRRKAHWTMLCSFQAHTMAPLIPIKSGKLHLPLTPVCRAHILVPEIVEEG